MTKNDIVKLVSEKLSIKRFQAKAAVNMTLDSICNVICEFGRIELRNLGVFEVKQRAARLARNPRTNEPVTVPPRQVVIFHPGKFLAQAVARRIPLPT